MLSGSGGASASRLRSGNRSQCPPSGRIGNREVPGLRLRDPSGLVACGPNEGKVVDEKPLLLGAVVAAVVDTTIEEDDAAAPMDDVAPPIGRFCSTGADSLEDSGEARREGEYDSDCCWGGERDLWRLKGEPNLDAAGLSRTEEEDTSSVRICSPARNSSAHTLLGEFWSVPPTICLWSFGDPDRLLSSRGSAPLLLRSRITVPCTTPAEAPPPSGIMGTRAPARRGDLPLLSRSTRTWGTSRESHTVSRRAIVGREFPNSVWDSCSWSKRESGRRELLDAPLLDAALVFWFIPP